MTEKLRVCAELINVQHPHLHQAAHNHLNSRSWERQCLWPLVTPALMYTLPPSAIKKTIKLNIGKELKVILVGDYFKYKSSVKL